MTPFPRVSTTHARVEAVLARQLRRVALWSVTAVGGIALVIAWFGSGPAGWGPRARLPLLLDLALLGFVVGVGWIGRRVRLARIRERDVSGTLEVTAGLEPGEVQGALELERHLPEGISAGLARRHAARVAARLSGAPDALAGALVGELRAWERRSMGALACVALVLLTLALTAPTRSAAAWTGLVRPVALWTGPELPALGVHPGNLEVPRGEDVEVVVTAPLRDEVRIRHQAAGDIAREVVLAVDGDGRASYRFEGVAATIRYTVDAPDGATTESFTIEPVDPLFVADVRFRLVYPGYLERGDEELRGEVDRVAVPTGTRIEISGMGSRPMREARLVNDDAPPVAFEVENARFEGAFRPTRDGVWRWVFLDVRGDSAVLTPAPFEVEVVPDAPPEVAIVEPSRDTVLPLDLRQPLVIRARDDHGLRTLELVAWRVDALGVSHPPRRQVLDLGGVGAVLVPPVLDLSSWELVAGDAVHYYAEVRDIHPSAQVARSETRVVAMPTSEALRRDATSRIAEAARELEALRERAAAAADATRDLARAQATPDRAREGRPFEGGDTPAETFGRQEDARGAVSDQQELAEEAGEIARELAALDEAMREAGAADPELARELREMQ
ncbi:MAG: DUF4175 family protein, partial [Longimicrobiales bacterium]|nr:DUF4175 family protein [Longimicrobiales bacterium]